MTAKATIACISSPAAAPADIYYPAAVETG